MKIRKHLKWLALTLPVSLFSALVLSVTPVRAFDWMGLVTVAFPLPSVLGVMIVGLLSFIGWVLSLVGEIALNIMNWLLPLKLTVVPSPEGFGAILAGGNDRAIIDLHNGVLQQALALFNEIISGIFLLAILLLSLQLITRTGEATLKKNLTAIITAYVFAWVAPQVAIMLIGLGDSLAEAVLTNGSNFDIFKTGLDVYGKVATDAADALGRNGFSWSGVVGTMLVLLAQFATVGALVKLAMVLLERILRLLWLTLISPFYFALGVLPNKELQSYAKNWWGELMRWIVALPLIVITLQIATQFFQQAATNNTDLSGFFTGGMSNPEHDGWKFIVAWAMATAAMLFASNIPQMLKLPLSGATQAASKFADRYVGMGAAAAGGAYLGKAAWGMTGGKAVKLAGQGVKAGVLSAGEGWNRLIDPSRQRFNNSTLGRWLATPEAIIKQREQEKAARAKRAEFPLEQAIQNRQRDVNRHANAAIGQAAFERMRTHHAADLAAINAALPAGAPPIADFADLQNRAPNAAYDLIHNHPAGGQAQRDLTRNGNAAVLMANAFQNDRLKAINEKASEQARDNSVSDLNSRISYLTVPGNNAPITEDNLIAIKALELKRRNARTQEERDAAEVAYSDTMNSLRGRLTDDKPMRLSLPRTDLTHPAQTNATRNAAARAAIGVPGATTPPGTRFHPTAGGPGRSTGPQAQPPAQPGGPLDHWSLLQSERQVDRFTDDLKQSNDTVSNYEATINQLKADLQNIQNTAQSTANAGATPITPEYLAKQQQLRTLETKLQGEIQNRSTIQLKLNNSNSGVVSLRNQLTTHAGGDASFQTLVQGFTQRGGNRNDLANRLQMLTQDTRDATRQGGHSLDTSIDSLSPSVRREWEQVLNDLRLTNFRGKDNLARDSKKLTIQDVLDIGAYTHASAK